MKGKQIPVLVQGRGKKQIVITCNEKKLEDFNKLIAKAAIVQIKKDTAESILRDLRRAYEHGHCHNTIHGKNSKCRGAMTICEGELAMIEVKYLGRDLRKTRDFHYG